MDGILGHRGGRARRDNLKGMRDLRAAIRAGEIAYKSQYVNKCSPQNPR
jgi:hypothetical protein